MCSRRTYAIMPEKLPCADFSNRHLASRTKSLQIQRLATFTSTPKMVCYFKDVPNISDSADLVHFCWRERNKPMTDPDNIDLVMVPTDGNFEPYEYKTSQQATSKTNGRIFALKFSSSSRRELFWLQSKPQARNGDASWFSPRDLKIGQIVDTLLQGDEVNVSEEIAQVQGGNGENDDDETMEDVEGHGDQAEHHRGGSGGAGPGATGGDIREEGSGAREGGADGGRA